MNKRHYEHTLPNIRGSLSNTYNGSLSLLSDSQGQLHVAFLLCECDISTTYFLCRILLVAYRRAVHMNPAVTGCAPGKGFCRVARLLVTCYVQNKRTRTGFDTLTMAGSAIRIAEIIAYRRSLLGDCGRGRASSVTCRKHTAPG